MSRGRLLAAAALLVLYPVYADAQSHLRFINATPEQLQAITVTIDGGDPREIEYGRTTTRIAVAEGTRSIKATTIGNTPVKLAERSVTLAKDKYYTITVTGELLDPSSYAITVDADDDTDPKGHLRVRYGLLSKGLAIENTTVTPDLHIVCEDVPEIRITGSPLKFTTYDDKTIPMTWTGAICRVTLEIKQGSVWVPVWQDLSNYFFSPHSIYTVASIGSDPASVVLIRETDNK
jgi:hypothetical protein